MVSNTLDMKLEDLYGTLRRLRHEYAADPEYVRLRGDLPPEWPM